MKGQQIKVRVFRKPPKMTYSVGTRKPSKVQEFQMADQSKQNRWSYQVQSTNGNKRNSTDNNGQQARKSVARISQSSYRFSNQINPSGDLMERSQTNKFNRAAHRRIFICFLLALLSLPIIGGGVAAVVLTIIKRTNTASTTLTTSTTTTTAGTWTMTNNMSSPRKYHAAVKLLDGTVLVTGGNDGTGGSGAVLNSAELYNTTAGTWTNTGSMVVHRQFHTISLLLNGSVLVAGGHDGSSAANSAELYDPIARTWALVFNMSSTRQCHTASVLANGSVLVAGGCDGNTVCSDNNNCGSVLSSCELFDPSSGAWTSTTAPMSTQRRSHIATVLASGYVLVAGGDDGSSGSSVVKSAELYNPTSGTWSNTGDMHSKRYWHTASLLSNGSVLVAGGASGSGSSTLSSAELFNPATGAWSSIGSMSSGRQEHRAVVFTNGTVLISGGKSSGGNPTSTVECYDLISDTWTTTRPMNTGRATHISVFLSTGNVLVSGGYTSGSTVLQSAELF